MKIGTVIGLLGAGTVAVGGTVAGVGYYNDQKTVVAGIIDGDTIDVEQGGEVTRIRLLNVDTPEIGGGGEGSECLAHDAKDFLAGLIPVGTEVSLEYDQDRHDQYGRTLAGVFKDDVFVNAAIASAGLGAPMSIAPNTRFFGEVSAAAEQARSAGKGIFGEVGPECFVNDEYAVQQFNDAKETIEEGAVGSLSDEQAIDDAKDRRGEMIAAIAALEGLQDKEFARSEFQQAAYGDRFESAIDGLLAQGKAREIAYRDAIEDGEERLEEKRKEEERRAEEARLEAERLEAAERATPPASASQGSGGGAGVDAYTGCRAYGGNYAMTSVDDQGRPYAKIDCTTKAQIG